MKITVFYQRVEALFVLLASIYFYHYLHFSNWLFLLLLFSMDIFMVGYIKNNKVGAHVYNFGHSLILPSVILVLGVAGPYRTFLAIGLIWSAHIGLDRALGYGLKEEKGFHHTHLGDIGKKNMKKTAALFHKDLPVYAFPDQQSFHDWLDKNYSQQTGFWMRLYKKATNIPTIDMGDAVDEALCYGWIDGLINAYDAESYLVRFTPRRPKSVWSKVNVAKVEKLLSEGRMRPSGLLHVEAAKADGRWDAAYSSAKQK